MRIGFIGLGLMGCGMAANLLRSGFALTVCDLSDTAVAPLVALGASRVLTPAEVAAKSDIVFTSLPTPASVEAVGFGPDGLAQGAGRGLIWFDLSTNAVDVVRDLHARCLPLGVRFLDAPVSGGPAGAASGKLAIWIGGDRAATEEAAAVLAVIADAVRHIGEIGAGTIAKLVHNMASTAIVSVLAEVMTLGTRAGLEPLVLWEAIRSGAAGRMRSFDNIGRRFLQDRYDPPTFALRGMHKDISLALQLARENEVPMRMCSLVLQDTVEALNRGWGEMDCHAFLQLQQERAGVDKFGLSEAEIAAVMART